VFETTDGVLYAPFRRAIWPCPYKHDIPPEWPMRRSVWNRGVQRPCSGHSSHCSSLPPDSAAMETHGVLYSPFRRAIYPRPHKHTTMPTIVNDPPRRPVAPRVPRVHKPRPPSHLEPIPSLYYPTIRRPVPLLPPAVRRPVQRVHVVYHDSPSSSTDHSTTGDCDDDDDDDETEVQLHHWSFTINSHLWLFLFSCPNLLFVRKKNIPLAMYWRWKKLYNYSDQQQQTMQKILKTIYDCTIVRLSIDFIISSTCKTQVITVYRHMELLWIREQSALWYLFVRVQIDVPLRLALAATSMVLQMVSTSRHTDL
jgi:hypothetical protein